MYAYAEFAAGWISDGNRRLNAIAGLGFDLVHFVDGPSAHSLNAQYDLYFLDYPHEDPEYFSPQNFIVHSPGLSWNWRSGDRFVAGLEAGVPIESGERAGWRAGGFIQFELDRRFFVGARIRHMENVSYRISSGTLGIRMTF